MSDSDPKEETCKAEAQSHDKRRETVLAQARKFLQQDGVRDADQEKKAAFLTQKGLSKDEIDQLLHPEASSQPPFISSQRASETTTSSAPISQPQPHSQSQSAPTSATAVSQPPPIITYPEFLTTSSANASPLITRPRLLTTLYLFSGLTALLYGTSNYLVQPMIQTLTNSRLELLATAKSNLARLTEKLEAVVSEVPPTIETGKTYGSHGGIHHLSGENESESDDEDPSELFHRDIGVQTSLPPSPILSASPDTSDASPSSPLEHQSTRLSSIHTSLSTLLETSTSEGHDATELEGAIGILREYLDSLAYSGTNVTYSGIYGSAGAFNSSGGSGGRDGKEDDEISRVKASIRGVKGVLLSARSFPGGMSARVGAAR